LSSRLRRIETRLRRIETRLPRSEITTAELPQATQLILSQRLGGEEIERPRGRLRQDRLQHRQVVAQRLAAGSAGDYNQVAAGARRVDRLSLVAEEPFDALTAQAGLQIGVQRRAECAIFGRAPADLFQMNDLPLIEGLAAELAKKGGDIHEAFAVAGTQSMAHPERSDRRQAL